MGPTGLNIMMMCQCCSHNLVFSFNCQTQCRELLESNKQTSRNKRGAYQDGKCSQVMQCMKISIPLPFIISANSLPPLSDVEPDIFQKVIATQNQIKTVASN